MQQINNSFEICTIIKERNFKEFEKLRKNNPEINNYQFIKNRLLHSFKNH